MDPMTMDPAGGDKLSVGGRGVSDIMSMGEKYIPK